jgi:hypothetical protein
VFTKDLDREPIQGIEVKLGADHGKILVEFLLPDANDRAADLNEELDKALAGWRDLVEGAALRGAAWFFYTAERSTTAAPVCPRRFSPRVCRYAAKWSAGLQRNPSSYFVSPSQYSCRLDDGTVHTPLRSIRHFEKDHLSDTLHELYHCRIGGVSGQAN